MDDDALVCETVAMILRFDGHLVDSATSAAQALEIFAPGKFDLIITDLFMPSMTGDKLAAAIKSLAPTQPVVMLTAYPEKIAGERPIEVVDFTMGKPFEIEALRDLVIKWAVTEPERTDVAAN